MPETNYAWGSERPSARRTRLQRQLKAVDKAEEALLAKQARERQELEAARSLRKADLEEVDVMTHGGAAPYDRSLEAHPKIANRPRVENTQAVYGRGAKLKRSTLPTTVIAVGDDALQIRKGAKAAGRKRTGKDEARPVAPEATAWAASSDLVDTVEMVPPGTSTQESVSVAPESETVLPDAAAEPVPDLEPDFEPEPLAAPMLLASQGAEMMAATRSGGPMIASAQVVDFFSKAVEAERAQLIVPKRMPKALDLGWADHWDHDPNAPLPEMIESFQAFGAAVDKRPEDLTDDEAFILGAAAMFPTLVWDRSTRKDVPNPLAFRRGQPVDKFRWENEIRRSGGTVQKMVAEWYRSVDDLRLEERTRRAMWPLALARRDLIKRLMTEVSAGMLSFAPRSSRWADLAKSVQWRVFRDADHEPLLLLTHYEMELYQQRIVDKLPWPKGLSRIELMEAFSDGMPLDKARGIVAYSTPPKWLVPNFMNLTSRSFSLFTVDRQPWDPGFTLPPRSPETEIEMEDVKTFTPAEIGTRPDISDEDDAWWRR